MPVNSSTLPGQTLPPALHMVRFITTMPHLLVLSPEALTAVMQHMISVQPDGDFQSVVALENSKPYTPRVL